MSLARALLSAIDAARVLGVPPLWRGVMLRTAGGRDGASDLMRALPAERRRRVPRAPAAGRRRRRPCR